MCGMRAGMRCAQLSEGAGGSGGPATGPSGRRRDAGGRAGPVREGPRGGGAEGADPRAPTSAAASGLSRSPARELSLRSVGTTLLRPRPRFLPHPAESPTLHQELKTFLLARAGVSCRGTGPEPRARPPSASPAAGRRPSPHVRERPGAQEGLLPPRGSRQGTLAPRNREAGTPGPSPRSSASAPSRALPGLSASVVLLRPLQMGRAVTTTSKARGGQGCSVGRPCGPI